jgi:outer membrane lipoprotein SlyB
MRSCPPWGGLEVGDALGAARGEAVLVHIGALAEAVLGDGEDELLGHAQLVVETLDGLPGVLDRLLGSGNGG